MDQRTATQANTKPSFESQNEVAYTLGDFKQSFGTNYDVFTIKKFDYSHKWVKVGRNRKENSVSSLYSENLNRQNKFFGLGKMRMTHAHNSAMNNAIKYDVAERVGFKRFKNKKRNKLDDKSRNFLDKFATQEYSPR